MNTRKMFLGVATVLAGIGLLGACAPAPTPDPYVPPTGPTDTKTIDLTCSVFVPSISLTTSATHSATITLTGTDPTPSGTGIAYAVDISGGIKNGPVATTGGSIELFTSLDGAPEEETATGVLPATAGSAFVVVPQLSGTSAAITAQAELHLTKITYTANAPSGDAFGTCVIAYGSQPGILIDVV
ncbi:MAG: hypothetical protein GY812_10050 [Actinomycetia bacterium]|nr:hypothetical protein [Actinomycetes bacterium]